MLARYQTVRELSESLCRPLETEDYVIQSMPDVSPTKWHLAHTSWFFEAFVLARAVPDYRPVHPQFNYLFNSYYVTIGQRHCRPRRGLLSRPTVKQVYDYRRDVDQRMADLLQSADEAVVAEFDPIIEIGLHHEQQHQELMLTDIKHVFSVNPLLPVYRAGTIGRSAGRGDWAQWVSFEEGLREIGHDGDGFGYDNEFPRHRVLVEAFSLASRLVTSGEYKRFIDDGGYRRAELWLSDGWNTVEREGWTAPLYWYRDNGEWMHFTLSGPRPVEDDEPVCHVSLFEADAYARWAGARLPTEAEWETAAEAAGGGQSAVAAAASRRYGAAGRLPPTPAIEGNFVEDGLFHPAPAQPVGAVEPSIHQMFGDVWEWTGSQYRPYPRYRPPDGALGEYNGKFMCNQFVLRGGSCATSRTHIRPTYRNFFPPDARWQFSGIRLARDGEA